MTICGLSTKLEDDANDERAPRRWLAMAGNEMLVEAGTRALGRLHALGLHVDAVVGLLRAQPQQEHSRADLASAALPTSAAYGEIVAQLGQIAGRPSLSAALREIGLQLGLLIYTQDAWEDWASDRSRGRFNPLHDLIEETERRGTVVSVMQQASGRLRAAFDSLTLCRSRDLLREVLVEGVDRRVLTVSQGRADGQNQNRDKPRQPEKLPWRRGDRWSCCDGCGCCGCDCSCH